MTPEPGICRRLLEHHGLQPGRRVFIDDMSANVVGVREQGMHAIRFCDAAQCERELVALGLVF